MRSFTIHITKAAFEASRPLLVRKGINMPPTGDNGHCGGGGLVVEFTFDGDDELLIDVMKRPVFMSEKLAEKTVREWWSREW